MTRKTIKRTLITLLSIVTLIILCAGLVINLILTPEKVTPIINKVAQQYLAAEIKIKKVDVSFFSTFPYIEIAIDSIELSKDSLTLPSASIERIKANINPIKLITKKTISAQNILLQSPKATLIIHEDGTSMLDSLLRTTPTDTIPKESAVEEKPFDYNIIVDKIEIENANIAINDRSKDVSMASDSLHLLIRANLSKNRSGALIKASSPRISFTDQSFNIRNKPLKIETIVRYNRDSATLQLVQSNIGFNHLDLNITGRIAADTLQKNLNVDLSVGLHTSSIANFMSFIPASIIKGEQEIKTEGEVMFTARIEGKYGKEIYPLISGTLQTTNASARYASMKWGIEDISTDIEFVLNMMNKKESHVDIRHFSLRVADSSFVSLQAFATDLFTDPSIRFSIQNKLDITHLTQVFPLQEGVIIQGMNQTDMKGKIRLSDLQKMDYGRISLTGTSTFNNLLVDIDGSKIESLSDSSYFFTEIRHGKVFFGNNTQNKDEANLTGVITFNGLSVRDKSGTKLYMNDIAMSMDSEVSKDSAKVSRFNCQFEIGGGAFEIPDTLDTKLGRSIVSIKIEPHPQEAGSPALAISIQSDSLKIQIPHSPNTATLSSAKIELSTAPPVHKEGRWRTQGILQFDNLSLFSALFPITVTLPSSQLELRSDTIYLRNTTMRYGGDQIVATGYVNNILGHALKRNEEKIKANLAIRSKAINLDTLLRTAMKIQPQEEDQESASDTTATSIIEIPDYIDLTLSVDIDSVHLDKIPIKTFRGLIEIKNQNAKMSNLSMDIMNAKMSSYIHYAPIDKKQADVGLDMKIKKIEIGHLTTFIPMLDTLAPMLKSMEGEVSFEMLANGRINSNYEFDIPNISSIVRLNGRNLVLLDGETFAMISKMLKFKNRNRNLIDSLQVGVIAQKGKVDVLPFELEMDRYRFIVGGTQTINPINYDINFKYNVSIIKSPLPFKAGVDIFGSFDKFDYKITKAKLKKTDFETQNSNIDSLTQAFRQRIRTEK